MPTKIGTEFQINTFTSNNQGYPVTLGLSNGNLLVVWQSSYQDSSQQGIYAQLFQADGTKINSEIQVNTYTSNAQERAAIASLTNGGFIIVWGSNQQVASGYGI